MSNKIDMMIVGAQKAGTTSLKNYLNEHPQVLGHELVEMSFFSNEDEFEKGYDTAFTHYYPPAESTSNKIIVAKHAHMYTEAKSLKRLAEHNPDCKLIFLLRHPVDRAYSAYNMAKVRGWMKEEFSGVKQGIADAALGKYNIMYRIFINFGLYSKHLQTMLQYFPIEQIKWIDFRDLKKEPIRICQDVFDWLDIDTDFEPTTETVHNPTTQVKSTAYADFLRKLRSEKNPIKKLVKAVLPKKAFRKVADMAENVNKSNKKYPPLDAEMRQYLLDFYKPHNQELAKITGLDLSAWEV